MLAATLISCSANDFPLPVCLAENEYVPSAFLTAVLSPLVSALTAAVYSYELSLFSPNPPYNFSPFLTTL